MHILTLAVLQIFITLGSSEADNGGGTGRLQRNGPR